MGDKQKHEAPLLELGNTAFTDVRGERIVEEMRKKLAASGFGVTVMGDSMCLRFGGGKVVSMQIIGITDDNVRDEDYLAEGQ